jgi:hypothetical protein
LSGHGPGQTRRVGSWIAAAGLIGFLAACQAGSDAVESSGKSAALRMMEHVATAAHKCWFASKDPDFKAYAFANELNSFSGQPRFLLVPVKHPERKPLLVVQAAGVPARVSAFGPLMQDELGTRIGADISRWSQGNGACSETA